jgi:hypothetical protein
MKFIGYFFRKTMAATELGQGLTATPTIRHEVDRSLLPAIVSNEGLLSDDRSVQFLLSAIWPGDEFEGVRAKARMELHFDGLNFANSCDAIASWLDGLVSVDGSAHAKLWARARSMFERHRAQSWRSRDAYDASKVQHSAAMYWPNPSNPSTQSRPLWGELPFAQELGSITKNTRIGSAGSCFAIEIKKHLKLNGFNYIETETNEFASANWGMHYNSLAFLQTVEWAIGERERPAIAFPSKDSGAPKFWDPFREGLFFDRLEDIESDRRKHRDAAKAALLEVDYLVLTLGLIEVWQLAFDDNVLARYPWRMAPELIRSRILSVQENVEILNRTLSVLKSVNPGIRMIVTVSPVPLYATFQATTKHVVSATQQAKSVLRVALEEFATQNVNCVSYFPAFETVMWCTENRWKADMRHVSDEAVANVMRLFDRMYTAPDIPIEPNQPRDRRYIADDDGSRQ